MQPTHEMFDITIIGGGPVGLFTAFYAGLRQAKVKIIESLELLGGQPAHLYPEKIIYDIPAYPAITGEVLTSQLITQLERFYTSFCLGEEALELERCMDDQGKPYFVLTTTKGQHYSRTVIIAAGNGAFRPRKLNLEQAESYEANNLHYYVNNLKQFENQRVAVCGGGDSAVDWALTLEPIAKKVYLIHRRDEFRALEHSVQRLRQSQVEILTPYVPSKLIGQDNHLQAIEITKARTDESQLLELDHFIVNYGFTSTIGQLKNWGLNLHRNAIQVDSHYQTNIPGVFAVGDIADYDGKVKIIATGFGEAPLAVNHALHHIAPDKAVPHLHSTSLFEDSSH
ncbi:NAD(P)/FAD-dependent oxidoreductase [Vaginisenegalia massiliensis]|uniref:NAD(P)/FAD-dependent oxidoreductase n=1 Tax=Vaginisenegalia massiliensis TaxID=2058294 RepID=UPI000F52A7F7|nr:NAD(P)/FAD-dependent oxidoreductase [Vaginisenegalia massiliensis]